MPMYNGQYVRHPLAPLVAAADDICYCVLDLEDAVELSILSFTEALELMLKAVDEEVAGVMKQRVVGGNRTMSRVHFARIRRLVFAALIEEALEGF